MAALGGMREAAERARVPDGITPITAWRLFTYSMSPTGELRLHPMFWRFSPERINTSGWNVSTHYAVKWAASEAHFNFYELHSRGRLCSGKCGFYSYKDMGIPELTAALLSIVLQSSWHSTTTTVFTTPPVLGTVVAKVQIAGEVRVHDRGFRSSLMRINDFRFLPEIRQGYIWERTAEFLRSMGAGRVIYYPT